MPSARAPSCAALAMKPFVVSARNFTWTWGFTALPFVGFNLFVEPIHGLFAVVACPLSELIDRGLTSLASLDHFVSNLDYKEHFVDQERIGFNCAIVDAEGLVLTQVGHTPLIISMPSTSDAMASPQCRQLVKQCIEATLMTYSALCSIKSITDAVSEWLTSC